MAEKSPDEAAEDAPTKQISLPLEARASDLFTGSALSSAPPSNSALSSAPPSGSALSSGPPIGSALSSAPPSGSMMSGLDEETEQNWGAVKRPSLEKGAHSSCIAMLLRQQSLREEEAATCPTIEESTPLADWATGSGGLYGPTSSKGLSPMSADSPTSPSGGREMSFGSEASMKTTPSMAQRGRAATSMSTGSGPKEAGYSAASKEVHALLGADPVSPTNKPLAPLRQEFAPVVSKPVVSETRAAPAAGNDDHSWLDQYLAAHTDTKAPTCEQLIAFVKHRGGTLSYMQSKAMLAGVVRNRAETIC